MKIFKFHIENKEVYIESKEFCIENIEFYDNSTLSGIDPRTSN